MTDALSETSSASLDDALLETLPGAVRRAAALWPDRAAWVFDDDASLTFAEVATRVDATARRLALAGIEPGQRVAVLLDNRPEFPLTWLALATLGATMVPLNTKYRSADAGYILAKSRAVALVTAHGLERILGDHGLPILDAIQLAAPESMRITPPAEISPPAEVSPSADVVRPESIVNVQFTSGTTGHPKGCRLTSRYWLTLARGMVDGFPRLTSDDIMLTAQPMSYMDPQWNIVAGLVSGATVVVLDGFHPTTFWSKVREHRVTYFYCLAAMPSLMLTTPPDPLDTQHRVRVVQCSAIPPARHAEIEQRWGVPWYEVFGMTETGGDIHVTDVEHDALVGSGSIGRPKAGREVEIVDSHDAHLPRGEVGELVIRGVGLMDGYDDEPEATADVFRNGWLHTGDLARMDDDGIVTLIGRVKDVVRRAGENVAAREVEETLLGHPAVRLAAVVSVADDLRGEEVKAYLVLTDGRDAREAAAELHDFCSERIARFKVPRYWEVRDDLPRTASERVAKKEITPGRTWDTQAGEWC